MSSSVWNTEKRDTKQNHHLVWCCTRAYETLPWKAVPIPGLCACHPCSLPEWWLQPWSLRLPPVQFTIRSSRPTMSWWFNMTLQVSSVMLCWVVLALACPEIVPFALPCCLSYICFGAGCAWSNRVYIEFNLVRCFRLPTSFAGLVFATIGIGHKSHTCASWKNCLSEVP